MAVTKQIKNQHLLWRAGFGVSAANISLLTTATPESLYADLEKASLAPPELIDVADASIKDMVMPEQDDATMQPQSLPQMMTKPLFTQKKEFRKRSVFDIRTLNTTWLNTMATSVAPLREKMALFWHGHFACRNNNIFYQQLLLQEIRTNALSNFGDLLKGVSKSAAMLNFLNNQQNQKKHPNENFAREVMELFTMGRGNYTETDVKEAARSFTGWSARFNGDFVFRPFMHDADQKTFLGKTGNYNGDDVLNIILEQPQTAAFITQKIYRYFVNDADVNKDVVSSLAKSFYQSNYDINALMKSIFTSGWFYDEKNIGTHIKSPVELLAGIRRTLPMQIENDRSQLILQRALGQILFYPPNVAGWQGGTSWIDSSTLMLRLRIPQLFKDDDTVYVTPKPDDDVQMGMKDNGTPNIKEGVGKNGFKIAASIQWTDYIKQFEGIQDADLYNALSTTLLQTGKNSLDKTVVEQNIASTNREEFIKNATIALMSTPEYQLC